MLEGKQGIVLGVANKRSLAWGIARSCVEQGAKVALTYQGERFAKSARQLGEKLASDTPVLPLDVTRPEDLEAVAGHMRDLWGRLDFVVHSIAFADPAELKGRFRDTSRAGFSKAMEISAFSLVPVARVFGELMTDGGSIVALSYLGGDRVVPNYNVMGVCKAALDAAVRYLASDLGPDRIRVNAVAPGPIKTVSAASVGDFGRMLAHVKRAAPLRRNVTAEEVGDLVAFLVSDMGRGVTGAHIPIDAGYSIMGVTEGLEVLDTEA
jgi:enoyl-[acyl-carrier protein] reductase I